MENNRKKIGIATLNVEGVLKDKESEINQLCDETRFHVLVLIEVKEGKKETQQLGGLGILSEYRAK